MDQARVGGGRVGGAQSLHRCAPRLPVRRNGNPDRLAHHTADGGDHSAHAILRIEQRPECDETDVRNDGAQRLARDHRVSRIERREVSHLETVPAEARLGERERLGLGAVEDRRQRGLERGRERARAHEQIGKGRRPRGCDGIGRRGEHETYAPARRVQQRRGGVLEVSALCAEEIETLRTRVVVGRRVQLERPVERVVGDDGQHLGPLDEVGREQPHAVTHVAVLEDHGPIERQIAEQQPEVLIRPGMREARPRRHHLDAGEALQRIRMQRVRRCGVEHRRFGDHRLVAEASRRRDADGLAALVGARRIEPAEIPEHAAVVGRILTTLDEQRGEPRWRRRPSGTRATHDDVPLALGEAAQHARVPHGDSSVQLRNGAEARAERLGTHSLDDAVSSPRVIETRALVGALLPLRRIRVDRASCDEGRDRSGHERQQQHRAHGEEREAHLPAPSRPEHDDRGAERDQPEHERRRHRNAMVERCERSSRTTPLDEQPIHAEPVAPREREEQHAAEHGEVPAHVRGHVQRAARPAQTRRQRIEEDDGTDDDDQQEHRPVVQLRLERQPIDEEAEVGTELGVGLAEWAAAAREQRRRPEITGQREGGAERHGERGGDEQEIPARHLLADLDVRDAVREHERDDRLTHGVEIHEREGAGEQERAETQRHSGDESCAPDVARAERRVPERVGVLLARPSPQREHERRGDEGADDDAPLRHVRRSRPAGAAILPSPPESRRAGRPSGPRTA